MNNRHRDKTPLIPESVASFFRRTAAAFRAPAPRKAVAIAALARVVELHHRMALALEVALERSTPSDRQELRSMAAEETRLALALGELVTELGGSPPRPEESSAEGPRDPRAISHARDQLELMNFVREDMQYVAVAQRELASLEAIPPAMRERLPAL